MSTRLDREKEFHNQAFSTGQRSVLDKYYAITDRSTARYQDLIESGCRGSRVLEYGCGPGSHSFHLAQQGARVTGIDISDVAIGQAKARASAEGLAIDFFVMNAESLELDANLFDLACGTAILHHLALPAAFGELARTLKPGGRAVFLEPLGHNPFIRLYRWLTPRLRTEDEHPLRITDLALMRKYFGKVEEDFYCLTALLSIPFQRSRAFPALLDALHGVDQWIFRRIPFLRRFAWVVVLTGTKEP